MEAFDAPVVPKSGMVRIRITAVHTASRYYGIIDFHFLLFFFSYFANAETFFSSNFEVEDGRRQTH